MKVFVDNKWIDIDEESIRTMIQNEEIACKECKGTASQLENIDSERGLHWPLCNLCTSDIRAESGSAEQEELATHGDPDDLSF